MGKRRRLELLERSQQRDCCMRLLVQLPHETTEEAILRYQAEHPDEEEGKEYFILQLVKADKVNLRTVTPPLAVTGSGAAGE